MYIYLSPDKILSTLSGIISLGLLLIIKAEFGGWVGFYLVIAGVDAVVGAEEPVLDNLELGAQEGLGAVVAAEAGLGGVEMVAPQLALRGWGGDLLLAGGARLQHHHAIIN